MRQISVLVVAVAFVAGSARAEVKLAVTADVMTVERGRVVDFTVTATDGGKPVANVRVAPYVDGKRWGTIGVTDDAGRATVGVPIHQPGGARVAFDVISATPPKKGEPQLYRNGGDLVASPAVSNELSITVTPPAPKGTLPPVTWDTMSDTWVATDGLGRSLPTFDEVGGPRGKSVGIFYYIWHEHFSRGYAEGRHGGPRIDDVMVDVAKNPSDPPFVSGDYWWSESLFGYYNAGDPYVLAKHAQMLGDAGVDVLVYDTSNNLGYLEQWLVHADVLRSIRETGQRAPQVAHLSWASTAGGVLDDLIRDFYAPGIARDLWFEWKGKPLLLANAEKLPADSTIPEQFALRTSWAWTSNPTGWFGDGKDKWPWLAEVPAKFGWHESPDKPEQMVVTAGHHASTNKGKSFSMGKQPPRSAERSGEGIQFAEQWAHALKVDPEFVFVTQWNEWIAGAFAVEKDGQKFLDRTLKKGQRHFIDEYDPEFSRDTEPMRGRYGDNYYYQLVANVRRFKGVRPIEPVVPRPIAIDGAFADWADVAPEFRDTIGDATRRDTWSWAWLHNYVNKTGRNDVVAGKVSYDADRVSFYVRTKDTLSSAERGRWMTLYVDADHDPKTGWLGYDMRVTPDTGEAWTNNDGKDSWTTMHADAAAVSVRHAGNELELSVPRSMVKGDTFDFKWADNSVVNGDWTDFTLNGDAAPNDRFNYRAKLKR